MDALRAGEANSAKTSGLYKSRFRDWHIRSSVRSKPPRGGEGSDCAGLLFFSPELVPLATHGLVVERGETAVHFALASHLLFHLEFTDTLENEIVTPAVYALAREACGVKLPEAMIDDARKIAVDEMYHALFATQLGADMAKAAGIAPPRSMRAAFLREFDATYRGAGPEIRNLVLFFFAAVSETLISETLSRVPLDDRVVPTVREVLLDHAEDEARHHAYFGQALSFVWPQMSARQRQFIGPLLPRLIWRFLAPDPAIMRAWSELIGLSPCERARAIEECCDDAYVSASVRRNAEATIRHLKRCGALDDACTADAMASAGLI